MEKESIEEIELEDADLLVELTEEEAHEEEFSWEDDAAVDEGVQSAGASEETLGEPARDPLSTATLAELYVSQGFLKRALTIYRELIETEPDNEHLKRRMMELKDAIDRDQVSAREHALDDLSIEDVAAPAISHAPVERAESGKEAVLRTLEYWLENIRRRR